MANPLFVTYEAPSELSEKAYLATETARDGGKVRKGSNEVTKLIEREYPNLYFSKKGKRYRSLGDQDITFPVKSDAKNISEIIKELKTTKISERSGRSMDHETEDAFERLRSSGYL